MAIASMSIFALSSCQSSDDAGFWWAMSAISGSIIDGEDQSRYRIDRAPMPVSEDKLMAILEKEGRTGGSGGSVGSGKESVEDH